MELSKRLKTIADMVTPGSRTADVGCDHGFVAIYLCREKIAPRVYAMDVRTGPLARAKEHIEGCGLSEYIETRLSDGLAALAPGEAQAIVCAGMGGRLMARILSEGHEKVQAAEELILGPQSELRFFREFLRTHGLEIVREDMVKEEGKFYPVIKAVPARGRIATAAGGQPEEIPRRLADAFGPCLLSEGNPVLREYLEMSERKTEGILAGLEAQAKRGEAVSEKTLCRKKELMEELADIRQALSFCSAAHGIAQNAPE